MKTFILKNLSKKIKNGFIYYVLGLVLSKDKKSCTNLAAFLNISHDFLYRYLSKTNLVAIFFPSLMIKIANDFAEKKPGWLIIDDTSIIKNFAKLLIGVWDIYDTVLSRPSRGLCLVVVAWSNGDITIPISFNWHYQKAISGKYYQTKTQVAKQLILDCYKKVKFEYILADGHYSTIDFISFLQKHNIEYLGKIARNRVIIVNEKSFQLQNCYNLKIFRNSRSKKILAFYHGMKLYFSVHKRKNKNNEFNYIYLVSTMNLDAKNYLEIYRGRWNIEMMFRTMKQYFRSYAL